MKNTTMANMNIKDDNIRTMEYENEEIEIDLLEILTAFKKRLWMILLALVIGGGLAGAFSYFILTPQYTSTAMVYILSKETTLTSLADLQIGSQLTKDYKIIVTSRPVLEDVVRNLGLGLTYEEMKEKIKIDNPADTRILSITAEDPDPFLAKQIADKVASTSSEYIGDIMEMVPPKLIEDGQIPIEKSSPSNTRNALLGAFAAVVLVCGVITVEVIMNDTVRSEEDVAKYLGLTVLASVPEREGEIAEDKEAMAKNKPEKTAARSRKKGRGMKR